MGRVCGRRQGLDHPLARFPDVVECAGRVHGARGSGRCDRCSVDRGVRSWADRRRLDEPAFGRVLREPRRQHARRSVVDGREHPARSPARQAAEPDDLSARGRHDRGRGGGVHDERPVRGGPDARRADTRGDP